MTCGRSVVFSSNTTDRHDITEILLNVALNTITITRYPGFLVYFIGQFNKEVTLYLKIQLNHIVGKSLNVLCQLVRLNCYISLVRFQQMNTLLIINCLRLCCITWSSTKLVYLISSKLPSDRL